MITYKKGVRKKMKESENRCDFNTTIENADYFALDDYNAGIRMNIDDIYEVLEMCSKKENIITNLNFSQDTIRFSYKGKNATISKNPNEYNAILYKDIDMDDLTDYLNTHCNDIIFSPMKIRLINT